MRVFLTIFVVGLEIQKKVHLSGWITDCVHMDEFNSLVVASSGKLLNLVYLLNFDVTLITQI